MEAHEFSRRMSAERDNTAPKSLSFQMQCGHSSHPFFLSDGVCLYCLDSREAAELHEELERQERELDRRRQKYPWL